MRAYVIANILSMLTMLIGVINVFTFREIWVFFAAAAIYPCNICSKGEG